MNLLNTIPASSNSPREKAYRLVAFIGLVILLGLPVCLLFFLRSQLYSEPLPLKQQIPQLSIATPTGEELSIGTIHAKKSLLLFFTVDCGHCEQALENLDRLYAHFRNAMEIVPVSLSDREKTRDFLQQHRYSFPVFFFDSSRKAKERFRITGIPALFLVDEHQTLRYRRVGERSLETDKELLVSFLLNHLPVKQKQPL